MLSGFENPIHILILVLVLALLFGAKRLPELGRSMGSGIREFKTSLLEKPTVVSEEPSRSPSDGR